MKGRSSIAFVKEKNVLKKCTKGGYSRGDGGRVLGVSFLFPYRSEIMLWEWLKLVKPQLVERSEKRSKRKNNWGWPVSPSVFTRVRSLRETRASQSPIVCEAKEKTKAEKKWKSRTFRVSLQSPLPSDLFCDRLRFLDLRKNTAYFAVSLTSLTCSDILYLKSWFCQSDDIWWHLCKKMYWNPEN